MRCIGATALVLIAAALAAGPVSATGSEAEARRLYSLALDRFLEGQARIMRIADPIRIAAAPFCGSNVVSVIGLYAANQYTFEDMIPRDLAFEEEFNEVAIERFHLDRRRTVLLVVPGLPADRAGLRPGDIVTRIDGKKPKRRTQLDLLWNTGTKGSVRLTAERPDGTVELEIESRPGCAEPSRFWFGTTVNAFAMHYGSLTGTYVYGGLLDLFESDNELATILGHELAHLILKHTQTRTTQRNEADADYLGVYLAARAGFDVSKATDVEDRLARANPFSTIDWGFYSHPISPARSLELRAAIDEIARKRERGEPLEPEER